MNQKVRQIFWLSLCLMNTAWANTSWAGARGEWLSLGFGRGNITSEATSDLLDDAAILLSGSVLRNSHIWSLRYARIGFEQSCGDVAFLYDRVLISGRALVSVGVGAGLLYRDNGASISDPICCAPTRAPEDEFFDQAGVAWATQVATGPSAAIGLGLQGFGSIAGDRSFWGVALVLQIGERNAVEIVGVDP